MRHKVHYQPDVPDYTGDGNFEPIACGLEEAEKITHSRDATTCENCNRRMKAVKAIADEFRRPNAD